MKAWTKRRTKGTQNRRLAVERLESRVVLDGGVRAFMSAGTLRIQGDGQDNQIIVEQVSPRSFTVRSAGDRTLINGLDAARTFNGVRKDVSITLGRGNDRVEVIGMDALMGRLLVDCGAGEDAVLISGVNAQGLIINTGNDNDILRIGSAGAPGGVRVSGAASILTGSGQDSARISDSTFRRSLLLNLGNGNDEAAIASVSVAKKSTIQGGGGSDVFGNESNQGDLKYVGFEQRTDSALALMLAMDLDSPSGEGVGVTAVGVADAAVVIEDALPNTALGNVLANDAGGIDGNRVVAVNGFAANVGAAVPGQYGVFHIGPDGTFTYILNNDNVSVNILNDGQTLTDTVVYTVSDGIDTAVGSLVITIQGNSDTTPLTAVADAATVVEDAIPNTAQGNVLANDTGGTAAKVVTAVNGFAANVGASVTGQFGFFQLAANGVFSYILNNDNPTVNALNDGQTLSDSLTYTVSDGTVTVTGTLTITIQGNSDTTPLAAVNDAAIVVEDGIPNTAQGNVLSNDTGGTAAKVVTAVNGFLGNVGAPVTGQFGFFQLFANGTFAYILSNDNPTVNALNAGQTLVDSITYTVTSGNETSTGTLAITIQGKTDTGPLVAVNDAAVVVEDAIPNTALGNVLANDTGGIATKVVTAVKGLAANIGASVTGQHGFFQIAANGVFTYLLRNGKAQVNALNNGQTLTDSITYTVSDGSSSSTGTLTITIQGVNG